jgi:hypothetical protein
VFTQQRIRKKEKQRETMKLKRFFNRKQQSRALRKQDSMSSGETEVHTEIRVIPNDPGTSVDDEPNMTITAGNNNNKPSSVTWFWKDMLCFLPLSEEDKEETRIQEHKGALPRIECIYDGVEADSTGESQSSAGIHPAKGGCCKCSSSSSSHRLPPLNSKLWPQAPLLLRPRPNSGTRVIGIRRDAAAAADYLWKPGMERPWWHTLHDEWDNNKSEKEKKKKGVVEPCCESCVILPINNGNEAPGESLVADFETNFFRGSLLLRLQHAEGTTEEPSDDSKGFFAGVPFRYQATIRGTFKENLPWTELMTGTRLDRRAAKVPPKWLMWTALKVGTCGCFNKVDMKNSMIFLTHYASCCSPFFCSTAADSSGL